MYQWLLLVCASVVGVLVFVTSEAGSLAGWITLGVLIGVSAAASVAFRRGGLLVICVLCIGVLVMVRYKGVAERIYDEELDQDIGTEITIQGVIARDPESRARVQYLVLREEVSHTLVRTQTSPYEGYRYGEVIACTGELEYPENFLTESNRVFAYDEYLKAQGIGYLLSWAECETLNRGGFSIRRALLEAKAWLIRGIQNVLPEPQSALLSGILIGERSALPSELEDAFRRTGVIHIVVLSGYNVALVADMVRRMARKMAPRYALGLSLVGIIAFMIVTGLGATVVRASVMASIVLIGNHLGKSGTAMRALVFAGLVMVLHNPLIMMWDVSFQLSFLATAGLVLFSAPLEKYVGWFPNILGTREHLVATLATQIAVLPILVSAIGEVSVIAPLANVLVLVVVAPAMAVGFVAAVVAHVSFGLALIPGFGVQVLLSYMIEVVMLLAQLPLGSVAIPKAPFIIAALPTLIVGSAVLGLHKKFTLRSMRNVVQRMTS